jgi:DNA-binding SARP family transcriptional activator
MLEAQIGTTELDLAITKVRELALRAGHHDLAARLQSLRDAPAQEPALEIDVLSGEVRRRREIVALSRCERTLLILLALQRRPCTRDELVEALYPHLDYSIASTQLKVYVHRVRRRLNDRDAIVYRMDTYRLGSHVRCDFWQSEAAVAHALRTRGALERSTWERLEAIRHRLARRDCSSIDDREWSSALQRRLDAMTFDVTLRLGEAALASGELDAALKLAREICDLDPCDERAIKLAIRSHLAAGNRSSAVRQLQRYERTLREELALEASPELRALVSSR